MKKDLILAYKIARKYKGNYPEGALCTHVPARTNTRVLHTPHVNTLSAARGCRSTTRSIPPDPRTYHGGLTHTH